MDSLVVPVVTAALEQFEELLESKLWLLMCQFQQQVNDLLIF
jgi:hypothetical protein